MMKYTREELLRVRYRVKQCLTDNDVLTINGLHLQKRKRGKRAGLQEKIKKTTPLPKILYGNVQSIVNKVDELSSLLESKPFSFCHCVLLTETWLSDTIPDSFWSPSTDCWQIYRCDRSEKRGGGVGIMLNNDTFRNNVKVLAKEQTEGYEILALRTKPKYLPREFDSVILCCIYIPPSQKNKEKDDLETKLCTIVAGNPNALTIVAGDFNRANTFYLRQLGFVQVVNFSTRKDARLDEFWISCDGYKMFRKAPLGLSDHNLIVACPIYKQKSDIQKSLAKSLRITSYDHDSFISDMETTDWD